MIYKLDYPPFDSVGKDGDKWINTTTNTLFVKVDEMWLSPFDSAECSCGNPNAHPPCGYCENGEYHMEGYDGWDYPTPSEYMDREYNTSERLVKAAKIYNQEASWKERAQNAEVKLQMVERGLLDKFYDEFKKENLELIQSEVREDVIKSMKLNLHDTVMKQLRTELYDKIDTQIRAEIREEVRLTLLKEIREANDRI